MSSLKISIPLLASALSMMLSQPITAATVVNFPNFATTSGLKLNGSAKIVDSSDGKVLRLTAAQGAQSGSAFSQKTLNANKFSTFFKFRITEPGGAVFDCNTQPGADGLVFVVQAVSESIGGSGQGIGYAGIANSVGVEFDTWCNAGNNDPNSNHLAIVVDGSVTHASNSADVLPITPDFDDGNIWYVWVDYDGTTLEVRANQTGTRPTNPTLSKKIDIPTHLGKVNNAYIGFTSGTGADWGNHDILSWEYRDQFEPIPSVPTPNMASCSDDATLVKYEYLGACGLTASSKFTLSSKSLVNKIRIWYDTNIGSNKLNVTINGSSGYSWTGTTTKGDCDTYQKNWCEGIVMLNKELEAGTYTVAIDSTSMCANPSGQTTLFVYGCPVNTTTQVTPSCVATYTNDGKLHIPYVSVPDAFGGKVMYEADMQLESFSTPFKFILTGVKAKQ